jgi:hypothetical protein
MKKYDKGSKNTFDFTDKNIPNPLVKYYIIGHDRCGIAVTHRFI